MSIPPAAFEPSAPSAPMTAPQGTAHRRISLSQLTVDPVSTDAFIAAAAAAGFASIGLRLLPPPGAAVRAPDIAAADVGMLRRRLSDAAVSPDLATGLWITPTVAPESYSPTLDIAAALGVDTMLVVVSDTDVSRALDSFCRLGALAAGRHLKLGLEFMAYTGLKTLETAAAFLERAAVPDAGLIVDALHLARAGDTPAGVAKLKPGSIALVQLCDAAAQSPPSASLRDEARHRRRLPGEGELPLHALLDALPADVWIDVEAPTEGGGSPGPKARAAAESIRRLLELRRSRSRLQGAR